jgi:hypothetical protein
MIWWTHPASQKLAPIPRAHALITLTALGTDRASRSIVLLKKTHPAQEGRNSPCGHAQPALILLASSSSLFVNIRPIPSNPAMVISVGVGLARRVDADTTAP